MRKILLLLLLSFHLLTNAQSSFTFSCTRDTLIPCTVPCITLKAKIPDLHGLSDSYVLNPLSGAANGCYSPYVAPDLPGNPTNLTTDDIYSSVIPIGFTFPFYGSNYTSLVASTNGYISFDISLTGGFSHYTVSADLPSASYDRALIMGPYHDLDPSARSNPPPEMRIKYDVLGTSPYRRWVFSFYHVPLYSNTATTCGVLNKNTHQIVLYESTGIIEIFVANKQVCNSWNSGKAILGIQDFSQSRAMMAPNRAASSAPWGTIGMNESWRFTPSGGASLFKRVELYDLGGTLITSGTTTNLGNNVLEASFDNVCSTVSPATYIVRSVYQKIDDPAAEIFGTDTVTITRGSSLPVTVTQSDPLCGGSNGSITVTDPVGAVYEYSIDGLTWQTSPIFNLPAGTYNVQARITGSLCAGNTAVTLTDPPPKPVIATITAAKCKGSSTGTITITDPVGADYEYSIDGGVNWQPSNVFNNLAAGTYTITVRQISISCLSSQGFTVTEPAKLTAFATTTVTSCANIDGTITITAGGATPAYAYSIDAGLNYVPSNIFTGLSAGPHTVMVRDANGCTTTATGTVVLIDTMRLELGPDSTICFGSAITLLPQTNALTDTFKWTPSTRLDFDTVKNPVASPLDTIKYYLTAKWGGCQRTDSIIINVKHKPQAFAGKDTSICYKSLAFLNGGAGNLSGPVNFTWSPSANVLPPNSPAAVAKPDTTQMYILTVTDNYGCNFSVNDSMLVTMEPPVPAYAGNDTIAILGVPHQLLGSGGKSYLWSPPGNLDNPFAQNPMAVLYNDTYFRLWVTDAIGCTAFDDVLIKVYAGPTYYVPNAFSPNGDGKNDIFLPVPVGMSQTDYFMVYNRLGELMFQTNQWLKGWDGKYKGKDALPGVYVWLVKGKDKYGKIVEMKGTVMLVR